MRNTQPHEDRKEVEGLAMHRFLHHTGQRDRQRDRATEKSVLYTVNFETYNVVLTVADWLRVDSGGPWLFVKVSFCLSVGEEQNKEE